MSHSKITMIIDKINCNIYRHVAKFLWKSSVEHHSKLLSSSFPWAFQWFNSLMRNLCSLVMSNEFSTNVTLIDISHHRHRYIDSKKKISKFVIHMALCKYFCGSNTFTVNCPVLLIFRLHLSISFFHLPFTCLVAVVFSLHFHSVKSDR